MSFSPTLFMLMAAHGGGPTIELSAISEHYFGMSGRTAQAKATAGLLPVPAFRSSQKAPYLIHLADLADYIDRQRQAAADHLEQMQVPGVTRDH